MIEEIQYGEYTDEELSQADLQASYTARCPICKNQLDHCGSGHHDNCPISKSVYVPTN
jgi:hypothetical protein